MRMQNRCWVHSTHGSHCCGRSNHADRSSGGFALPTFHVPHRAVKGPCSASCTEPECSCSGFMLLASTHTRRAHACHHPGLVTHSAGSRHHAHAPDYSLTTHHHDVACVTQLLSRLLHMLCGWLITSASCRKAGMEAAAVATGTLTLE